MEWETCIHNNKSFLYCKWNLLIRFGEGNLPCLHFDLKALAMPFILTQRHWQCLPFHLKWEIFTYYRNDNASRLRRSHRNNSQIRHSRPILIPHSSLVASPLVTRGESKWSFVTRLGIIFFFHSWQSTHERKKPVPSPQPKGIKTFLSLHCFKHVKTYSHTILMRIVSSLLMSLKLKIWTSEWAYWFQSW
jgi:hypothetical protein